MELERPRDFVGYAQNPPAIEWPDGKKIAVNVVINYEEGSETSPLDGDEFTESLTEGTYPVFSGMRQITNESVYEYGSRVGIWRLVEILREFGAPYTIFACALALERNPEIARALVADNADMVGHGYRWVSLYGLAPDEEREQIRKARDSIRQTTGVTIRGWLTRAPQSLATRRILAEEGFLYDTGEFNDDTPYFETVDGRPFLIIPYTLTANDFRYWQNTAFTAADFATYCIDEFDELRREAQRGPRMMSVGLHSRILGRPGRAPALRRFLEHISQFDDVWLTTRTAIAEHWTAESAREGQWNAA
jgi:peptidoglycan/xylan/chitin deacetylase (PgdA/CDA1 family)